MKFEYRYPDNLVVHGILISHVRMNLNNFPKGVVGLDILQDWITELQKEYQIRKEAL
jgi:hypothetical protein